MRSFFVVILASMVLFSGCKTFEAKDYNFDLKILKARLEEQEK